MVASKANVTSFNAALHYFSHEVWAQFHQRSTYSFYACRSQKRKKDSQVVNHFYDFGIYEHKICT